MRQRDAKLQSDTQGCGKRHPPLASQSGRGERGRGEGVRGRRGEGGKGKGGRHDEENESLGLAIFVLKLIGPPLCRENIA